MRWLSGTRMFGLTCWTCRHLLSLFIIMRIIVLLYVHYIFSFWLFVDERDWYVNVPQSSSLLPLNYGVCVLYNNEQPTKRTHLRVPFVFRAQVLFLGGTLKEHNNETEGRRVLLNLFRSFGVHNETQEFDSDRKRNLLKLLDGIRQILLKWKKCSIASFYLCYGKLFERTVKSTAVAIMWWIWKYS